MVGLRPCPGSSGWVQDHTSVRSNSHIPLVYNRKNDMHGQVHQRCDSDVAADHAFSDSFAHFLYYIAVVKPFKVQLIVVGIPTWTRIERDGLIQPVVQLQDTIALPVEDSDGCVIVLGVISIKRPLHAISKVILICLSPAPNTHVIT